MRALLLAAGIGSRLRPLTETVPKCLVPIHGRPLLDYWLDLLFRSGVERVLINTHWLADSVRDHVAGSRWRARVDLVHESELLGTAGTILANRNYFEGGPALVAHADNLTDFDVAAFAKAHRERPQACALTMLTFRADHPSLCGVLELGSASIVEAFHEKADNPPGNLANAAVYCVEPEVVDFIAALGKPYVDFSVEVIPLFIGRIFAFKGTHYHRDIGTLDSLMLAQRELKPWRDRGGGYTNSAA